jgi:hypothetical protein
MLVSVPEVVAAVVAVELEGFKFSSFALRKVDETVVEVQ